MAASTLGPASLRRFHGLRAGHESNAHVSGLHTFAVTTTALPIVNNQTVMTPSGKPITINLLANAFDPNAGGFINPATITITMPPTSGMLSTVNATTGSLTYTPTSPTFTGTDQFTFTVSDTLGNTSMPATITIQVNPSITVTSTTFSAFPGLPLNDIVVATFTDTNPNFVATELSAVIDWGDGQMSSGTVNPTTLPDTFTVTSSSPMTGPFTYLTAVTSQFVPGTTLPVTITITDNTNPSKPIMATANSSAVLLGTGTGIPFTGHLAVTASNGPNAAGGYATTDQPIFSGTAPPFSIVQVYDNFTSGGMPPPPPLGQTTANASGLWSLTVGPLTAGVYNFTATVTTSGSFLSGPIPLGNDGQIKIDTTGPSVSSNDTPSISMTSEQNRGQVTIVFNGGFSGMNTSNLLRSDNYRFFGHGLVAQRPKTLALGSSSTAPDGDTTQTLLLTIKVRPSLLKKLISDTRTIHLKIVRTDYVFRGSGSTVNIGVTDQAGNPFQGGVVRIADEQG